MKKSIFLIMWIFSCGICNAQNIVFTQTIKGTVTDQQSGNVLQNITVSIDNASLQLNAVTDEKCIWLSPPKPNRLKMPDFFVGIFILKLPSW